MGRARGAAAALLVDALLADLALVGTVPGARATADDPIAAVLPLEPPAAVLARARVEGLRVAETGHLTDTPENRKLILELANDPACFQGMDMWGNDWYARIDEDGSQLWAEVRNGVIIRNCGRKRTPRP